MIDYQHAKSLVLSHIKNYEYDDIKFVILDDITIEKPYGWVFFYDMDRTSQNQDDMLAGNAPLLVLKANSQIIEMATHMSVDDWLDEYESNLSS